jgi:hypothetical protein
MTLSTHPLAFSATAVRPLHLDGQPGASAHAAIVGGLRECFCAAGRAIAVVRAARRDRFDLPLDICEYPARTLRCDGSIHECDRSAHECDGSIHERDACTLEC